MRSCAKVKCLTTNGISGDGRVCLKLLFSQLHSAKNNWEPTVLMGSKHVVGLTVAGVVTMENGGEALVNKTVNEVVTNGNGEANVHAEGVNCIHNPLVVHKDRGGDKGTVTILVGLPNMLKCSMRLVGVAGADFMKDGSADLQPSKLLDLLFNLEANLECVSVC
jgi:hypothetical protein